MKCLCGYEYVRDHWDKEENPDVGDKEFINIEGDFKIEVELNRGGTEPRRVRVFACPKCGTLKINS